MVCRRLSVARRLCIWFCLQESIDGYLDPAKQPTLDDGAAIFLSSAQCEISECDANDALRSWLLGAAEDSPTRKGLEAVSTDSALAAPGEAADEYIEKDSAQTLRELTMQPRVYTQATESTNQSPQAPEREQVSPCYDQERWDAMVVSASRSPTPQQYGGTTYHSPHLNSPASLTYQTPTQPEAHGLSQSQTPQSEVYISVVAITDGKRPGVSSLRTIRSIAFNATEVCILQ